MFYFCLCLIIFIVIPLFFFRKHVKKRGLHDKTKRVDKASVLIVIGSGGHTSEILSLVKAMGSNYCPRYYVLAETDITSESKVKQCEKAKEELNHAKEYSIFYIPRSREVKQSYLSSIWTTLRALVFSFPLVLKLRPNVILCNGPGTCLPICIIGLILKLWHKTVLVYVESFCRVKTLSLTGKLLYPFVDSFFVQWPDLLIHYPKANYVGRFV